MPYTVTPSPQINQYVNTTLKQVDYIGEPITKKFELYNATNAGYYQAAMRAYEGISQAGIATASANIKLAISDFNTTSTDEGGWPKAADVLILGFSREHPVASMAGTTIFAEFTIVAPHPEIVDDATPGVPPVPIMTRGVDFATAADRPEALGALVDWLEDALVVTVLKVKYPGAWTYRSDITRFANLPKQYDALSVS